MNEWWVHDLGLKLERQYAFHGCKLIVFWEGASLSRSSIDDALAIHVVLPLKVGGSKNLSVSSVGNESQSYVSVTDSALGWDCKYDGFKMYKSCATQLLKSMPRRAAFTVLRYFHYNSRHTTFPLSLLLHYKKDNNFTSCSLFSWIPGENKKVSGKYARHRSAAFFLAGPIATDRSTSQPCELLLYLLPKQVHQALLASLSLLGQVDDWQQTHCSYQKTWSKLNWSFHSFACKTDDRKSRNKNQNTKLQQ